MDYYTLDGHVPEYSCGGCPHCRANRPAVESPTVGNTVFTNAPKSTSWSGPLAGLQLHANVYFPRSSVSKKRLIQKWKWLVRLVEVGAIRAISAEQASLEYLGSAIQNVFWIGNSLEEASEDLSYWPHLVLHLDESAEVPSLGWPISTKLLLAPDSIPDAENPNRRWWESVRNSVELKNFLFGLDYGDH
jgi:ATP-dependent DNA helicase RecQ